MVFLGTVPSRSETGMLAGDPAHPHLQAADPEGSGQDGEQAETDSTEIDDRTLHPGPETEARPGSTLAVGKTPLADVLVAIFQFFGGAFKPERDEPRRDGPWR